MNHRTEPSLIHPPWALQMLRVLVVPALLALTLLSASVLYVNWAADLPMAPTASTSTSTSTIAAADPSADVQQPTDADTTLARLQAP